MLSLAWKVLKTKHSWGFLPDFTFLARFLHYYSCTLSYQSWTRQTQEVSSRNNDVPTDKEVEVLPIFYNSFYSERDCRIAGSDSAHQNGFTPQQKNGSFSSLSGEQIAAGLWFRSRVAQFAFLKGNNSTREKDHA